MLEFVQCWLRIHQLRQHLVSSILLLKIRAVRLEEVSQRKGINQYINLDLLADLRAIARVEWAYRTLFQFEGFKSEVEKVQTHYQIPSNP